MFAASFYHNIAGEKIRSTEDYHDESYGKENRADGPN